MGLLFVVHPGDGAPQWCSLEVWQAVSGRPVYHLAGDEFGARLKESGVDAREVNTPEPQAAPTPSPAPPSPAAAPAGKLRLSLLAQGHAHGHTSPEHAALAGVLVELAAEHEEIAFLVPRDDPDPVVRAVLERALRGDVEIEVVVGMAPRGHRLLEVVRVMARLRGPGGCPWDAQQTHRSLAKYLLDESYELLHAIEQGSDADIAEELGDVLLQVVFHAQLGHDDTTFDVDDVANTLVRKLVGRHPHVFADVEVTGADEVVANWDAIKEKEKDRDSFHEGIPESLPALAWAAKLQRRAGKAGFDWDDAAGPMAKVREELAEVEGAEPEALQQEIGDLLLAVVALSRHADVDAETALREAGRRFRSRVTFIEDAAKQRGVALRDLGEKDLAELWSQAKQSQR